MSTLPPLAVPGRTITVEQGNPLVMGIVNAGPDSFSDSVRLDTLERQVGHALALVAAGADIIDVGGESGVTYTDVTPAEVEAGRVVPLVERLVAAGVTVSVDTWKPEVARAAVDADAAIFEAVSGLAVPEVADVSAASGAALVGIRNRGGPNADQFTDDGGAVVSDDGLLLPEQPAPPIARGVAAEQLLVDPGPDFAKTPAESAEVLRALPRLHALGRPILLPVSRKYVIGAITGRPPGERLAGTLAALLHGVAAGAAVVRVHDVAAAVDAIAVWRVLEGQAPVPEIDTGDDALKWIRAAGGGG